MRIFFCFLFIAAILSRGVAQSPRIYPALTIGITSENDAYRFRLEDGYYTNGLFVRGTYLPVRLSAKLTERKNIRRVTSSYTIGQMIFNSQEWNDQDPEEVDRPYTAYLFLKKGFRFFYQDESFLGVDLSVATIGPSAMGQSVQQRYHRLFKIRRPRGWDTQLNDEPALNANVQYNYSLLHRTGISHWLDIRVQVAGQLGNTFTNLSGGGMLRLGNLRPASESAFFDGMQQSLGKGEFFIFVNPRITRQFYDATFQGGLFRKDKGPVVTGIRPWFLAWEAGLFFAHQRFSGMFSFTNRQRAGDRMRADEHFASLTLALRLGKMF